MSLGTASLPPLMIARGYSVFANGGFRITPWFIDEVRDRDNQVIFKEKPATACPGCVGTGGSQAVAVSNVVDGFNLGPRSEEHTSELQSLMRISYAVFCLKKKTIKEKPQNQT